MSSHTQRRPRQKFNSKPVAQENDNQASSSEQLTSMEKIVKPRRSTGISRSLGKPLDRHDAAAVKAAFAPTSIAATASAERNDPLLDASILIEGASTGAPVNRPQPFTLDYSQFNQLVNSSYSTLSRTEKLFSTRVSRSQFFYYCITLLWKRILTVLSLRADFQPPYLADVMERKVGSLAIPKEIGLYLDGIGDIVDYNGVKNILALQAELSDEQYEGISGTFGPLDGDTHYIYETIPSPYVALRQIIQDFAFSKCGGPAVWNLPEGLRPNGPYLPNRNLLGWDTCVKLTPEQQAFCVSSEVYAERDQAQGAQPGAFEAVTLGVQNMYGYPIVYHLLAEISTMLATCKHNPALHPASLSSTGSVAQSLFNIREGLGARAQGLRVEPVYRAYAKPLAGHRVSASIMSASSIFRYRIKRSAGTSDCLCFTGPNGGAPPGWLDTVDFVFDSVPRWNIANFVDACRHSVPTVTEFCARVRGIAPHA